MKKLFARVLSGAAAAGAAAGAGCVVTVAIAFAIYAFSKTYVSAAWASAIVAVVFAVFLGVGLAVVAAQASGGKPNAVKRVALEPTSPVDRILEIARERPLAAAAAAVAAGLLSLRNPALVATVLSVLNQPPRPRRE